MRKCEGGETTRSGVLSCCACWLYHGLECLGVRSPPSPQLLRALPLAQAMGVTDAAAIATAVRAAHLAKADLATSTVMEMTALAGTMGRHYAYQQV